MSPKNVSSAPTNVTVNVIHRTAEDCGGVEFVSSRHPALVVGNRHIRRVRCNRVVGWLWHPVCRDKCKGLVSTVRYWELRA